MLQRLTRFVDWFPFICSLACNVAFTEPITVDETSAQRHCWRSTFDWILSDFSLLLWLKFTPCSKQCYAWLAIRISRIKSLTTYLFNVWSIRLHRHLAFCQMHLVVCGNSPMAISNWYISGNAFRSSLYFKIPRELRYVNWWRVMRRWSNPFNCRGYFVIPS